MGVLTGLVAITILFGVAQLVGTVTLWFDPVGLSLSSLFAIPMNASVLAATVCSILAIAASSGVQRQRAAWSLIPLPCIFAALQAFLYGNFSTSSYATYLVYAYVLSLVTFIAPLALTYAALNRRLIEIGFVLNRTVVFALVSAIVIGIFVLAEWSASEWLVSASHTTSVIVGMVVALTLGLSMRYIHKYVDRFVDHVFFRKRHQDEAALRALAHEASFITDQSICWTAPCRPSGSIRMRMT